MKQTRILPVADKEIPEPCVQKSRPKAHPLFRLPRQLKSLAPCDFPGQGSSSPPYGIGCWSNVLAAADALCSGESSCEIRVPNLEMDATKPCHKDLKTYLDIDFTCVTGERLSASNMPAGRPTLKGRELALHLSTNRRFRWSWIIMQFASFVSRSSLLLSIDRELIALGAISATRHRSFVHLHLVQSCKIFRINPEIIF